ncbi:Undecaprenyl-phosphate mannosyltransferase [Maioricimonas rarisocia]|uniref:Undecaprenyl-phosphate mannosyltransferase n=1 Tax=Maioricimonas rarisocia TaxID=2528026 RepID=A0A517Z810_9PLAN|nr:glycosyltransferase family 2 protein [Maioricimonas rarisocia]QDU38571.1 Undecaprenyl-phosphate mannosyltransferase [Maioricimonas rarisocia]
MSARYLTALPVFNEEQHVVEVLGTVRQFCGDVLVVDDGSSDRTPCLLQETEGIAVVRHEQNAGYGAALRTAFDYAIEHGYDALVTIDCDGQHEPRLIPELADALFPASGEHIDIVSGSRYLKTFDNDSLPPADRKAINFEITQQLNNCFGLELTDSFCGFKAYHVEALRKFEITELGYAMPLQLWIQAVRHQMQIVEFPIPLVYLEEERSFGGSLDDARRRMAYYQQVIKKEMDLQEVPCGADGRDQAD